METLPTTLSALAGAIAAVSAIVIGLVQVIKKTGVPKRWLPLSALVIGVGVSFIAGGVSSLNILLGIVAALSSMGLWNGTKATLGK